MKKIAIIGLMVLGLMGCAQQQYAKHPQKIGDKNQQKDIVIFFDGTANTEISRTNVALLHNLVILQPNPNIQSIYLQGVGTDGLLLKPLIGMMTGAGIGEDVRLAYRYLANTYRKERGDKIYLFGFSRGAYAARILSGLVYTAGIADFRGLTDKEQNKAVKAIYSAYKGKLTLAERRAKIADKAAELKFESASIEFFGLWDTVEALGVPNYSELISRVNGRYVDQICNVKRAAHALSIDDNRAQIFTPISLTTKNVIEHCPDVSIDKVVNEVWFAGAHSDVGGGYSDSELNGVSLNWMIRQMSDTGLLPENSAVYEDPLGLSHDPSTGFFGLIYKNLNRNIPYYMKESGYNGGQPKVHKSVFERLEVMPKGAREFDWIAKGSKKYTRNYPECFDALEDGKIRLKEDQHCFDVIY